MFYCVSYSTAFGVPAPNTVYSLFSYQDQFGSSSTNRFSSPSEFISSTPYLVVQHIDWIQCRYLLVQVSGAAGRDSQNIAAQNPADPGFMYVPL